MMSATLERFKGKTCDERTTVQWVFENLMNRSVEPEDAPSPGAWGLLQECRSNPEMRSGLLENIWPKLLPTKSKLEAAAVRSSGDNDDRILQMIRNLRTAPTPGSKETES